MTTTPIPATGSLASLMSAPTDANATGPANQMGKDTFLKLLVAQLKYQNPLSPTDGTQFLAQTAQFTMVEKLSDLSTALTQVLASDRAAVSTGMLGQKVTAAGADGKDVTGLVTAVRLQADGPVLTVNGKDVPLASVKEVERPSTT